MCKIARVNLANITEIKAYCQFMFSSSRYLYQVFAVQTSLIIVKILRIKYTAVSLIDLLHRILISLVWHGGTRPVSGGAPSNDTNSEILAKRLVIEGLASTEIIYESKVKVILKYYFRLFFLTNALYYQLQFWRKWYRCSPGPFGHNPILHYYDL